MERHVTCDAWRQLHAVWRNGNHFILSCRTQKGYYPKTLMACPSCAEGAFLPGEPTGTINSDFQGAYYAPGPLSDGAATSKRTVLLLTDAFGLPLKNCKIMADDMAKRLECDVWIPDYFAGERWSLCTQYWFWLWLFVGKPLIPVDAMSLPDRPGVKFSLWDWVKLFVTIIPRLPTILVSNRSSVTDGRVHSVGSNKQCIPVST